MKTEIQKIAIIIPAYNEEKTIKDVIKDFYLNKPNAFICVIDNNSSDRTSMFAKQTIIEMGCKGAVLFERLKGKAQAVKRAFNEVDADIYVMVDADSTYFAKDLKLLLKPIENGEADMVVGDRLSSGKYSVENKRKFHGFGNAFVRKLINLLFNSKLKDIMSGYRAFNKKFIRNYPILVQGFELETDLTLHALDKRFSIVEIPIDYKDRPIGSNSKLNTFYDGIKVIRTIFKIFKDYRPMAFFSITGLIIICSGFGTAYPVIEEYVHTQFITHIPLAILSVGLVLTGLICITIGIILSSIVNIQNYNYRLILNNFEK